MNPLEVQFARDAQGKPTASSPPPIEAVGAFFEHEVGPDPSMGEWVLETLADFVSGRRVSPYTLCTTLPPHSCVTIDANTIEVYCAVGEAGELYQNSFTNRYGTFVQCTVALPEFRTALENWMAFIHTETMES